MSASNGIYRIAQVIKWIGRVVIGLGVSLMGYATLTVQVTEKGREDQLAVLVGAIGFVVITEVIAWVLEGFSGE